MYARSNGHQLGAWYNSLSDLTGDIVHAFGGGNSGGTAPFPPGAYPGSATSPALTQQMHDDDDLALIRDWTVAVKANGGVPARMPAGRPNAGELASRDTGPGTEYPNATAPFDYTLATTDVLAADHRVSGRYAQQMDAIVPLDIGGETMSDQLLRYGKYAAIGIAAIVLVPVVLRLVDRR